MARFNLLFLLLILWVLPAASQSPDAPTSAPINIDVPVFDTITATSPFDIWEFSPIAGEQYRADMQAADGLAPLLGLRDGSGDIVVASNQFDDGTIEDARPDDLVTIFFEIPSEGAYALVATRVGTDNGTTVGSYTLTLSLIMSAPEPDDTYVDVTFRCGTVDATTASVVLFGDQNEASLEYVITAYGFDGFEPVIRLGGDDGSLGAPCELPVPLDGETALEFRLGDSEDVIFGSGESISVAVYTLSVEEPGPIRVTIGSRSGTQGRYALHIVGLAIESAGDSDFVTVRSGPFARTEPQTIWMLRDGLSRLDPLLTVPDQVISCPDLGLRTCSSALNGSGIRILVDGTLSVATDRLDSVARLDTGTTDPVELAAASQNGRTTGAYSIWLIGMLPAVQ